MESEFEQSVQPVFVRGGEELTGFFSGQGFEASGLRRAGADVAGDVARDLLLAHRMLQGGLEDGVHVGEGQGGEPPCAALPGGAAEGLIAGGVEATGAALTGGAELVEPRADVLGGELGELLLAQAGDEVEAGDGGVAGVGVLAELVDGDVLQPVRQVRAEAALRGRREEAAVTGGDLLGEFGQGFLTGGAVDVDAFAGVAGGEDVSGGFPALVLALVDGSVAVGADAAGGGGVAGCGHQAAASCSRRVRMRAVRACAGMQRARPRVMEVSCRVRMRS